MVAAGRIAHVRLPDSRRRGAVRTAAFVAPDQGWSVRRAARGSVFHALPHGQTLTLCSFGAYPGQEIDSANWLEGAVGGTVVTCEWCQRRLDSAGLSSAGRALWGLEP